MSHKERCISYCIEYLNQRNLAHTFEFSTFNHYYRKFHGAMSNAYHVGISAADMMIDNFPTTIKNIYDRRNESETAASQRA